jgi:hypothetical protein
MSLPAKSKSSFQITLVVPHALMTQKQGLEQASQLKPL